jgi:nitrite reductase (NADH) small subunit
MSEVRVGRVADFTPAGATVVHVGDVEVGVFLRDGRFYGYENRCFHQGGPACEGMVVGKVETVLDEQREVVGDRLSETEIHFVCPWHGWEYDLRTGECATDRRLRLRRYEVVVRDGEVFVVA